MSREFKVTEAGDIQDGPTLSECPEFLARMRERNLRYAEWRRKREALARRPSARLRRFVSRWFALLRWGIGDAIMKFGERVRG